uniref:DUF6824 domain-containing protein n=1 Tax=Craspedostauros australis TaxID=1486917 RepID=A0A7R9ZSN7_9STRA|mmetsp:Transcript_8707/g.23511  ORF Transcript_8707/g.23511 Transcript_8707/m.23511 type:complete len:211 (+) Transcript_8707:371-1003(+)
MDRTATTITTPSQIDVLLGRGKNVYSFPGSIRYRKVILKYKDEYSKAKVGQKWNVVTDAFREIRTGLDGYVVRFWKKQPAAARIRRRNANGNANVAPDRRNEAASVWEEVEERVALRKVQHALRETKKASPPTPKDEKVVQAVCAYVLEGVNAEKAMFRPEPLEVHLDALELDIIGDQAAAPVAAAAEPMFPQHVDVAQEQQQQFETNEV